MYMQHDRTLQRTTLTEALKRLMRLLEYTRAPADADWHFAQIAKSPRRIVRWGAPLPSSPSTQPRLRSSKKDDHRLKQALFGTARNANQPSGPRRRSRFMHRPRQRRDESIDALPSRQAVHVIGSGSSADDLPLRSNTRDVCHALSRQSPMCYTSTPVELAMSSGVAAVGSGGGIPLGRPATML